MTQCERIAERLSSGRWTPREELSALGICDVRKRLSEMCASEPGRYESRMRRRDGRGEGYTAKDWRDTSNDEKLMGEIAEAICRAEVGRSYWLIRFGRVDLARLARIGRDELAAEMFARYIDPWGVE